MPAPPSRRIAVMAVATLIALALLAATAQAATYPTGFEERTMVDGLTMPTSVAWTPDGRTLVTEKKGALKIADPSSTTATTALDISAQVNSAQDRGLLDVAVDSNFLANGYIYLLYTREMDTAAPDGGGPMASRLTRYVLSATNQLTGATDILGSVPGLCAGTPSNSEDCLPSEGWSHSIGTVRSAPDGTLYVGSGDAASYSMVDPLAYRTYDENSLAGKIMHIDRNGQGVSGHPFCTSTSNLSLNCTKLWAKGFRNPFRFALRPGNAGLTIGDVGWNTREEVDLVRTGGKDFGWPCYEGTIRTSGYQDRTSAPTCDAEYAREGTATAAVGPKYDYPHVSGSAILGGPTYTGTVYPTAYRNTIFVGDYAAGFVRRLTVDAQDTVTDASLFIDNWQGVDLEAAPDNGDLVYASFGTGAPGTGAIKRVVYAPLNGSPTAKATSTPRSGASPLTVTLSGSGSSDPDNDPLTYTWAFGDGSPTATGVSVQHTYSVSGTYTATLTVADGRGGTDTTTVQVGVDNNPPTATIQSPANGTIAPAGQLISLQGSATDPEQGALPASALSWRVILHHADHTHPMLDVTGVSQTSFTTRDDHDADSYYEVVLTARDAGGFESTDSIVINPKTVNLTLLSNPAGAPMSYSGINVVSPHTRAATVGYKTTISAAPSFVKNGHRFVFASWSDAGAAQHNITIPASDLTLNATYTDTGPVPPVLALGFDDGTGTTAKDSSSFNNDGVLGSGAAWAATGKYGKAVSFDGIDDWVTVADSNSLDVVNDMTLEAWVKPASVAPWRTLMAKENTDGHVWALYAPGGSGNAHSEIGVFGLGSPNPLPANQWTHIAMTFTGTTMRLYVDGAQVASRSDAMPSFATGLPLHIGGNSGWADEFFSGLIDEVRIYDRALTSQEIGSDMLTPIVSGGPPPDTTPPAVAVTAPADGATVSGTSVNLTANASDASGIDRVQFKVDGGDVGASDTSSPYSATWDSTLLADGVHRVSAVAYDTRGNTATSSDVTVNVDNVPDNAAGPKLALGFEDGSGTTARDSSGNGNTGTLGGGPVWTPAGKYGNALTFDGINDWVTVADANSLDMTTAFTVESWVKPRVNGAWDTVVSKESPPSHSYALYATHDVAAPRGEIGAAGQNGTAALTPGAWTHVAMTFGAGTLRLYVNDTLVATRTGVSAAVASTGALRIGGNAVFSGEWFDGSLDELRIYDRALTVAEVGTDMLTPITTGGTPPDTTPPTVSMTGPADGATVSGANVGVAASASDASGIANVQFKLDGNNLGGPDTTSPYGVTWDTTTATNGTHTLTAVATDGAGNPASSSVSVTVSNAPPETTPPTVSMTAPVAGATVSGTTVNVAANATDASGIARVQFRLDGADLGSPDTSSPYAVTWDSTTTTNGIHKLSAVATDTVGNPATSADVSVTVSNVAPPPAAGLVLGLGFEDGTGTTARDSSTSANNASINGPLWSTGGRYGKALSFDGINDILTVADANSLDLTAALTVEAWVKPRVVGTWDSVLMKEKTGGAAYDLYAADGAKRPEGEIGPAGTSGTTALPSAAWSHIAITYAAKTLRIYVNGVQVGTRANVIATTASTGALRIGGNTAFTGEWFDGLIDEVRVYNRALSAAELQTDMNAPVVAGTPGTTAHSAGKRTKLVTPPVARKPRLKACTAKQVKKAKKTGRKPTTCVLPKKPAKKK